MGEAPTAATLPLEGVVVLDLGRVLAGPFGAQLLGDYGAEVIRVEDLNGDETRRWPPVTDGESSNFQSVNRNKRAIALDLKSEGGRKVFRGLVKEADVIVHSFLPEVAARLGLDPPTLEKLNPNLIVSCVSGYGAEGPMAGLPGYDLMLQAYTGIMELTGDPDGPPMRAGCSMCDITTGLLAFTGVLLALLRRRSGENKLQTVNVSLFQSALTLLGYHLTNYANGGRMPRREGSGVGHLAPYRAFQCPDGYLLAGATNDQVWQRMATALGRPEWGTDARFANNKGRVDNRAELYGLLDALFAQQPRQYWIDRLLAANIPAAPIRTIDALFGDPQSVATKMLLKVPSRNGTEMTLVGAPITLSECDVDVRQLPPMHGEHTDEILREKLSLSPAEIETLRTERAIAG